MERRNCLLTAFDIGAWCGFCYVIEDWASFGLDLPLEWVHVVVGMRQLVEDLNGGLWSIPSIAVDAP